MSYMGVTCGEVDPWDVFRKVCESIEAGTREGSVL